ncbi:MAG TPA: metallophosphoesterase [Pyrinomonadaceae bacterium]|nr:metallophosphoesterase [Pyrinomonadaceae bacterium]
MSSIRILHASDIHLAKRALQRSIPDQAKITEKLVTNFLKDLKKDLLSANLTNLKETFAGILSKANIALLEKSQAFADKDELNAKIDKALEKLALSEDSLFRDFIAEITRTVGLATSYHPLALDSLVNFAQSRSDLHAVILSGDIATTGFKHDLLKAQEFLDGPTSGSVSKLGIPVWILPGNHDRYQYTAQEWFFSPGGTHFDEILGNHWSGKVKAYPPLRDIDDRLSVLVLAADFGLQNTSDSTRLRRFNKLAQGKVYEPVLTALASETISQQEAERNGFPQHEQVILWAVHFPPLFRDISVAKSLLEATALVNKAKELGVHAILAGHTHYARDYFAAPDVRVLCAGTATQNDSVTKHCQIISVKRISGGPSTIDVAHYEWDKDRVTFQPMKKEL